MLNPFGTNNKTTKPTNKQNETTLESHFIQTRWWNHPSTKYILMWRVLTVLMIFENDLAHSFRVSLRLVMKLKMALSSVIGIYLMVRNMELYLRFLKLNIANLVKYILIHNFLSSFYVNIWKIYSKCLYKQLEVSERRNVLKQ